MATSPWATAKKPQRNQECTARNRAISSVRNALEAAATSIVAANGPQTITNPIAGAALGVFAGGFVAVAFDPGGNGGNTSSTGGNGGQGGAGGDGGNDGGGGQMQPLEPPRVLLFTKTGVGGTDHVWIYDLQADGYSLDDKRSDLLPSEKLGVRPTELLAGEEHAKNNLPDVLARWQERGGSELVRPRTAQSFCVAKEEIAASGGYDLSLNRYKETEHAEIEYAPPAEIIAELRAIEAEISDGLNKLEEMLG